jgi:hypothetical protein
LVDKIKNKQELKKLLKKLKATFISGESLKLIYLPGQNRISNNKKLNGEVLKNHILLYESDLDRAKFILIHEFIEFILNKRDQSFISIINSQNRIIEDLLYRQRELLVDSFTNSLVKNGFTSKYSKKKYN